MKIEKILFPTDFSEGSDNAVLYPIDLAKQYNATLFIIHIVYDVIQTTGWDVPHLPLEQLDKDLTEGSERQLDEFCTEVIHGVDKVEKRTIMGVPHQEIVQFAEDEKIDLVVIGTHGRTGLDRALFGSTAERVVRMAPCPVLSVRIPLHRK